MKTRSEKHKQSFKFHVIYKICLISLLSLLVIMIGIFAWKQQNPWQENSVSQSTSTTGKSMKSKNNSSRIKSDQTSIDSSKDNVVEHEGQSTWNHSNDNSYNSQQTQNNDSDFAESYPTGNDVAPGYVPGEGTKFAYNIARAGGLITGPHSFDQEDEFYHNSDMTGNSVTYNGQTVNYGKVYRPDGTYYYQVTPAN